MISAADFTAAQRAAGACLYKGNALLGRAVEEPTEHPLPSGETIQEFRLSAEIVSFCKLLDEHRGVIPKVEHYLKQVSAGPIEHDGMICTTAHRLGWDFAHRLWLTAHNVLCEQAVLKDEWYEAGPGFQLDRQRLDANWQEVRDRLRLRQPIDAQRIGALVAIEAAKAAALLAPAVKEQVGSGDDPDQLLSPAKLADRLGIPAEDRKKREALRKRLETWRNANRDGGWIEVADRKGRQPGYLYPLGKVWAVIEDMKPSG